MDALSTGLVPAQLRREELPSYDEHHKAKHRILEEYMKVWMAKLARTYPRVAVVDGFASAGRYRDGRVGSPIIFMRAFLDHTARTTFRAPPHFVFIEERRDFAQHLQWEIDQQEDLRGARVDVIRGTYAEAFPRAVDWLTRRYGEAPLPTFAFVDPLGYENTPWTLLRDYRRRLGRTRKPWSTCLRTSWPGS